MAGKPFVIACIAAPVFGAFASMACHAADLTIASSVYARQPTAKSMGDKHSGEKSTFVRSAKADKAKRHDKEAQRRIVTYSLYQDSHFKLNGAFADKRHFGMPPAPNRSGSGLGSGFGNSVPAQPPLRYGASSVAALKLNEPESAGIDFGCGDRPFRSSAAKRELTACYKHNVDKSWKTQTYLSREYADGSQKWGGGLAVRYAY